MLISDLSSQFLSGVLWSWALTFARGGGRWCFGTGVVGAGPIAFGAMGKRARPQAKSVSDSGSDSESGDPRPIEANTKANKNDNAGF